MKWINIKKEKPRLKTMVLISTITNNSVRLTPHIASIMLSDTNGEKWMTDNGDEPVGTITHWMYLPEDPI